MGTLIDHYIKNKKHKSAANTPKITDKKNTSVVFRRDTDIEEKGSYKKYIVSSVVEGAPIDKKFLKALETYARINKAKLVLLWMRGVYKTHHFSNDELTYLKPYLASEYRFNGKLLAKDFMLHPAQKNPVTGLSRYAQNEDSLICASTKQTLFVVPRQRGKTPHTIHTTGTISSPSYSKTRVGCIADQDNKKGALVIEIPDNTNFFIRQVQWINNCFVDLGKCYTESGCSDVGCCGFVLGDLHLGEEDQTALNATLNQIAYLKPNHVFIHDVASNNSINHHDAKNCISKASLPKELNTLEKEWTYVKNKLYDLRNSINSKTKIHIVPSNHDDFVYKWLSAGDFVKDPRNAKIGAKLFVLMLDGKNPMSECLNVPGIDYLKKGSSFKVEGWECAEHGHLGNNGSKGSIKTYINAFDKAIIAHSHTPQIQGDIIQVGTLSKLSLPYTSGASSWMHANGVIYKGGHTQLIVFLGEKWHA